MRTIFCALCAIGGAMLWGAGHVCASDSVTKQIDIPLVDAPLSGSVTRLPRLTMRQATGVSVSFFQSSYPFVAGDVWQRMLGEGLLAKTARLGATAGYVALAFNFSRDIRREIQDQSPGFSTRGFFNKSNPFDLSGGSFMGNERSDSGMALFKRQHAAELVRSHAIGYELGNALNSRLLEDAFFYGTDPVYPIIWFSSLYYTGLIFYNAQVAADSAIEKNNRLLAKAARIGSSGLDFISWAYDLDRPDEPYGQRAYENRSIDIGHSPALSGVEKDILNLQGWLSFLNWIDPRWLLGPLRALFGNKEMDFNAKFAHNITPFGYSLEGKLLCRSPNLKMYGTLRFYRSRNLTLPGFEGGLVDLPLSILNKRCFISPSISSWLQPLDQRFDARKSLPGAQAACRLSVPVGKTVKCWTEVEGKSKGWVAGNDYLDASLNFRFGIQTLFK